MNIKNREAEIIRIRSTSVQPDLLTSLASTLHQAVLGVTQVTIESALVEELLALRKDSSQAIGRRSGYFTRTLDTEQGRIEALRVPKLRSGNKARHWQILTRYQRSIGTLMDFALSLYVLGLSLRDLQEAFYHLLGHVLSVNAINRVTLEAQRHMESRRHTNVVNTPPILIVDGVWVDIQYTQAQTKVDRSGHVRRVRHAEERVVLVAMAVWPDGTHEILHYEVATQEDNQNWSNFFTHLIDRGLAPEDVQLVVSDGTLGLPAAMAQHLPKAQQQRCITHKIRRIQEYLKYAQLPSDDDQGQPLKPSEAKRQRRYQIQHEAYHIYNADTETEARQRLDDFIQTWQPIEPKAVKTFQRNVELTFSYYQFDIPLHCRLRTTNQLERFFEEFRRKSDEIGAFPNEASCLTIFFLIVQRDQAKHNRPNMAKTS